MISFQLASLLVAAASPPSGILNVVETSSPPVIDGIIHEDEWAEARTETCHLHQFAPNYGELMTQPTTISILHDDDFIYFAFFMQDTLPDQMIDALTPRDNYINGEWIAVLLDTWNDGRSAFSFEVSLANSQMDSRISEHGNWDYSWDAVWESGTARLSDGWSAEFAIPLSCLRFPDSPEQLWSVNFQRILSRTSENGFYMLSGSQQMADLSDFAELRGVSGIEGSLGMELRPYASGSFFNHQATGEEDLSGDAGLDLKMGLTSGVTADFTLNPDFGQVEADEAEMNLGHFELFLQEKRPFFMERSELFSMPFNLFYSRRIGAVAWNGELIPILGGAKVTGSLGNYRFGFLNAVTGRVWEDDTTLVQGAANYSIFRGIREFQGYSYAAVSGVSRNVWSQEGMDEENNSAAAFDGALELPGDHLVTLKTAGSFNTGMDDGGAYRLEFDRVRSTLGYWINLCQVDESFNVNGTGYTTITDYRAISAGARKTFRPENTFSSFTVWGNQEYLTQINGETLENGTHMEVNGSFKNGWNFTAEVDVNQERFDPYEGPGGHFYSGNTEFFIGGGSNPYKPFKFWLGTGGGGYECGGTFTNYTGNLRFMPAPTLELLLYGNWFRTYDTEKFNWQTEEFDSRSTDWRSMALKLSYMFNPEMNLRLFSQYSRFNMDYDTTGEMESSEIRANMLFSWQYMPGSMFYLLGEAVLEEDESGDFQDPDYGIYAKVTWFLPF